MFCHSKFGASVFVRSCSLLLLLGGLSLAGNGGGVGAVSFPISCAASAAPAFERGLALLHSFEYRPAREQFHQVELQSPECAIAYWGDAMTNYHQLWDRPSARDYANGRKLVRQAQAAKRQSPREHAYIEAAAAFYDGSDQRAYDDRWDAYSRAMQRVAERYRDDQEAAAFYALSLIASPHAGDDQQALRKQAVRILQPLFAANPHHPGLAHYIIHACDNPEMAQQGLAAARVYAQIAPDSPHALHMPSHIFARLGLWQDDIRSNLASKAAAEEVGERGHRLHAMDFLEYAYLQTGEITKAQAVMAEALSIRPDPAHTHEDGPSLDWVRVHFPGQYALEVGAWTNAQSIRAPAGALPELDVQAAWIRAVASGHLRDAAASSAAAADLNRALEAVRRTSYAYLAEDLAPLRDEARAWSDFAAGQRQEANDLLRRVAARQDAAGKGETEIPAREMLADMLLENNQPAEALAAYKQSLKTDPNRRNSLLGQKKAAALCRTTNTF